MKSKTILLLVLTLSIMPAFSQSEKSQPDLELYKRYLKLGSSYREVKEFDLAKEYICKARKAFSTQNNFLEKYWYAAATEELGYLYKDRSDDKNACIFLNEAKCIFDNIIKQKDGSQVVIKRVLEDCNADKYCQKTSTCPIKDSKCEVDNFHKHNNPRCSEKEMHFQHRTLAGENAPAFNYEDFSKYLRDAEFKMQKLMAEYSKGKQATTSDDQVYKDIILKKLDSLSNRMSKIEAKLASNPSEFVKAPSGDNKENIDSMPQTKKRGLPKKRP